MKRPFVRCALVERTRNAVNSSGSGPNLWPPLLRPIFVEMTDLSMTKAQVEKPSPPRLCFDLPLAGIGIPMGSEN